MKNRLPHRRKHHRIRVVDAEEHGGAEPARLRLDQSGRELAQGTNHLKKSASNLWGDTQCS